MSLLFYSIRIDSLKFALSLQGDFELGLLHNVGTVDDFGDA